MREMIDFDNPSSFPKELQMWDARFEDYIRNRISLEGVTEGEVILANTNSYIISFDSTMEKYIHIVRPDNIKLIQKFKNKI